MNFIQNLYNEIAKSFRIEVITTNVRGEREVKTTYAVSLPEAIGKIAQSKELLGVFFESGRVFDDCGVNVYEIDYSAKATAVMMDF